MDKKEIKSKISTLLGEIHVKTDFRDTKSGYNVTIHTSRKLDRDEITQISGTLGMIYYTTFEKQDESIPEYTFLSVPSECFPSESAEDRHILSKVEIIRF